MKKIHKLFTLCHKMSDKLSSFNDVKYRNIAHFVVIVVFSIKNNMKQINSHTNSRCRIIFETDLQDRDQDRDHKYQDQDHD